jgi:hypothetical protein
VMDDNPRLTEWIAYHYFVMPLRHLVLSPDPSSLTGPAEVVERWRPYLTIEVWNDTSTANTTDPAKGHWDLIRRQENFYKQCGLYMQAMNRTWTMFSDVDEYWTLNENFVPDWDERMQKQGSILNFLEEIRKVNVTNTTVYNTTDLTVYQGTEKILAAAPAVSETVGGPHCPFASFLCIVSLEYTNLQETASDPTESFLELLKVTFRKLPIEFPQRS